MPKKVQDDPVYAELITDYAESVERYVLSPEPSQYREDCMLSMILCEGVLDEYVNILLAKSSLEGYLTYIGLFQPHRWAQEYAVAVG